MIAPYTWFRVGGPADFWFSPESVQELSDFLKTNTAPYFVLGAGSNVLIRDGGIEGYVIKLGKAFHQFVVEYDEIEVGASLPVRIVAERCQRIGLSGLEFFYTIPGTVGGAIVMNAGCYGSETIDRLISVSVLDQNGCLHCLLPYKDLSFGYRFCSLPEGWIVISAKFRCISSSPEKIALTMQQHQEKRDQTQPLRQRTGGSTFANPKGHQAWKLIEECGYRGFVYGGAQVSEKHANFLINNGNATAFDLEMLGETIREGVLKKKDILLEWEIIRYGRKKN